MEQLRAKLRERLRGKHAVDPIARKETHAMQRRRTLVYETSSDLDPLATLVRDTTLISLSPNDTGSRVQVPMVTNTGLLFTLDAPHSMTLGDAKSALLAMVQPAAAHDSMQTLCDAQTLVPGEPLAFEKGALSHRRAPDGTHWSVRDATPLSALTEETIQLRWRNVAHVAFGTRLMRFRSVPLCKLIDTSGVLRPFGMQHETNRNVLLIPCTLVDVAHAITLPNTTLVMPKLFTLAQVRDKIQEALPRGARVTFRYGSDSISEHDHRFRMPLERVPWADGNDDERVLTVQVDQGAEPQYVVPPLQYMFMHPTSRGGSAYEQALRSQPMDVHVRLLALRYGQYVPLHSMQVHVTDGFAPLRQWVDRIERSLSASYAANAKAGVRVRNVWIPDGDGWQVLGRQSERVLYDALPDERVALVVEGLDEHKARAGVQRSADTDRVCSMNLSDDAWKQLFAQEYYRLPPRAWFQDAVLEQATEVLRTPGRRVTDLQIDDTAAPFSVDLDAAPSSSLTIALQLGTQPAVRNLTFGTDHSSVGDAFVRQLIDTALRTLLPVYGMWLAAKDVEAGSATHLKSALQRALLLTVIPKAVEWRIDISDPGNHVRIGPGEGVQAAWRARASTLSEYRDAYEAAVLLMHHRAQLATSIDKTARLLRRLCGVPKEYSVEAIATHATWQALADACQRDSEPHVVQLVGHYLKAFGWIVLGES